MQLIVNIMYLNRFDVIFEISMGHIFDIIFFQMWKAVNS